MTNQRKKLKAEKKAKAKKQKAKHVQAAKLETKKSDRESGKQAPPPAKTSFSSAKNASSKPTARASSPERRTQGK